MVSPYAAGLGGFMSGFAGGMQIGDKLKQRFDEHAAQKAREEAIAEARQQYQQQVQQQADAIEGVQQPVQPVEQNETVSVTPVQQRDVAPVEIAPMDGSAAPRSVREAPAARIPAAGGLGGAPVTQQVVATPGEDKAAAAAQRQQSTKIAQRNVGSEREAIDKAISEKMRNFYMDRGEVEKADAWEKYAESQKGRKYIKQFAGALKSLNLGDNEGFINNMVPILEDTYGEGFTIQKRSPVKDKDGNITGANFEIRNTRTGEVTTNNIPIDQLANIGMQLGSPEVVLNRFIEAQQAQAKAKAEAASKVGELTFKHRLDLEKEGVKQQHQSQRDAQQHEFGIERDTIKSDLDAKNQRNRVQQELEAKVGALSKAGYSQEFITNALPDILGINQYKKTTSPEEAKRLAFSDRMKNDPSFARKPADQQRQIIEQDMSLIYAGAQPSAVAPAGNQQAAQSPAAGGLPQIPPKPSTPGAQLGRDRVTGQLVWLDANGKPIQ